MMEAIMTFNSKNSWSIYISSKNKKIVHVVLQLIAIVFISAGFILAIINKNSPNMEPGHFTTPHSKLGNVSFKHCYSSSVQTYNIFNIFHSSGLTSFICTMISVFNGLGALIMSKNTENRIRYIGVKIIHALCGSVTIVLGLWTLILGVNKTIFINVLEPSESNIQVSTMLTVFLALCAFYIIINPLINMKAYLPKMKTTSL